MAYHLERLIDDNAEHRSGLSAATLREATDEAEHHIKAEGVTVAAIREAPAGDRGYGSGRIVATYTEGGRWARNE